VQNRGEEGTGFWERYGPDSTVQRSHLAAGACGTRRTAEEVRDKGKDREHNRNEITGQPLVKWC